MIAISRHTKYNDNAHFCTSTENSNMQFVFQMIAKTIN